MNRGRLGKGLLMHNSIAEHPNIRQNASKEPSEPTINELNKEANVSNNSNESLEPNYTLRTDRATRTRQESRNLYMAFINTSEPNRILLDLEERRSDRPDSSSFRIRKEANGLLAWITRCKS